MTVATTSSLPRLHTTWMSALLEAPLPAETRATCADCAMCRDVPAGLESFDPRTKCCTYLPALPNFLVGALLADEATDERGRASVRARIASGVAVTPLGLGIPPTYGVLYHHGAPVAFGRAVTMRCPHYLEDTGRCGIWLHRNAVCATWFCKHERGAVGWRFWQSVRELLSAIEAELARACLLELDVGAAAIAHALPPAPRPGTSTSLGLQAELCGERGAAAAAARWGRWAHREEEFYVACAAFVQRLDFAEILGRCGHEVRLRIEVMRSAWKELREPAPPARLRMSPLVVLGAGSTTRRVSAYSALDPLEMPRELLDLLHHYDGRVNAEARAAIASAGIRLTPGLERKLADFEVLVPDEPS
jgi:hypothetical protein